MTGVQQSTTFTEWLADRDTMTRARIVARIRRTELGNFGDCKLVGDGVDELRLDFGPGYRVYLASKSNALVILLAGGHKGTQTADIRRAKEILNQWTGDNDSS